MKSVTRLTRGLRPLLLAVFAAFVGMPAQAEQAEDCPTWFPDVRCERSGRYEGFIRPLSQPYLFEDPFITTGVYAYGIYHEFPGDSAFRGGNAWVVAVQARLAITDRLAFIATKDGYMWVRPDKDRPADSALADGDGFMNLGGGLKYALIDMPEQNFILSPSFRIEVPTGSSDVYQGYGSGAAIPTVSTAWAPPGQDIVHLIGDLGFQLPFSNDQSDQMFFHLHSSFNFVDFFTPFMEVNGLHYLRSGDGDIRVDVNGRTGAALGGINSVKLTPAQNLLYSLGQTDNRRFDANDVANLGSEGMSGRTIMSMAFGVNVPITKNVSFAGAYEFPLTSRRDILKQRGTININYEF